MIQSDGIRISGDVVLATFNNASKVEDSISDQIYDKQMRLDWYYEDCFIKSHEIA